jgi:dihydropteroate synthase
MGILNITPDSFSGDGLLNQNDWLEAALQQAVRLMKEGADILDVGGESTRPGALPVSLQQELDRVIPVIDLIHRNLDAPLSVDTYKAQVAQAALQAGADWINDVWGLRADPDLAKVAARSGKKIVLMHNRSKPDQLNCDQGLEAGTLACPIRTCSKTWPLNCSNPSVSPKPRASKTHRLS